jgi:hypothetical protein
MKISRDLVFENRGKTIMNETVNSNKTGEVNEVEGLFNITLSKHKRK